MTQTETRFQTGETQTGILLIYTPILRCRRWTVLCSGVALKPLMARPPVTPKHMKLEA